MAREHDVDLSRIKNALRSQIGVKLLAAEIDERQGKTIEAANGRRIAAEWQKVADGTT